MQLIYLAPLAWSSFAQRPHMFVRWFHEKYSCPVLWVNPYPTRFPAFSDFKRITQTLDDCATEIPEWLEVVSPKSLPIEPMVGSQFVHTLLWKPLFKHMQNFVLQDETLLALGKPSELALQALKILPGCKSFYDAMDDYPQFYSGLSRAAFVRREQQLVKLVSHMSVSSSGLKEKWENVRGDIQLARNALMPDLFLPIEPRRAKSNVMGYVGTIAQWFDWEWIGTLAQNFPDSTVKLIGPCYTKVPENLPVNIQILPACNHAAAIAAMKEFDIGLIPFKQNQLTASVDPIKFYEYRALGIPVVASAFGEMLSHQNQPGVFLSYEEPDIAATISAALAHIDTLDARVEFIAQNTWRSRFDHLQLG